MFNKNKDGFGWNRVVRNLWKEDEIFYGFFLVVVLV